MTDKTITAATASAATFLAALSATALTPLGTVLAQDVRVTASGGSEVVATDSAGGVTGGGDKQGDLITSVTGRAQASVNTARTSAAATYSASYDQYFMQPEQSGFRQSFIGVGSYEPWEERLFLDARASLSQTYSGVGLAAASERSGQDDVSQVFAYSFGPTFRQRLGSFAQFQASYHLAGTVFFDDYDVTEDDDDDRDRNDGSDLGDTLRHDASVSLYSGRDFDRLRWNLLGRYTTEDGSGSGLTIEDRDDDLGVPVFEDGDDDGGLTTKNATANLEYRVIRSVGLLGTFGYDEVEIEGGTAEQQASEQLTGPFWAVGLRLNPSPRTDVSIQHGRRYDEPFWSGELEWRPTQRTSFAGRFSTEVVSQQDRFIDDLEDLILVDSPAGQLACDPILLTCGPIDSATALVDTTFRMQRLSLSARHERETRTYTLNGQWIKRDFVVSGETETTYAASLGVEQQLRPETVAQARISYTRSTGLERIEGREVGLGEQPVFGDEPVFGGLRSEGSSTVGVSLSVSHEFATDLTGSLGYTHLRRSEDDAGIRTENALIGRIAFTF